MNRRGFCKKLVCGLLTYVGVLSGANIVQADQLPGRWLCNYWEWARGIWAVFAEDPYRDITSCEKQFCVDLVKEWEDQGIAYILNDPCLRIPFVLPTRQLVLAPSDSIWPEGSYAVAGWGTFPARDVTRLLAPNLTTTRLEGI